MQGAVPTAMSASDRPTPPDAAFDVPGLGAPCDILIDPYGVPHIRAASRRDAFLAQGFNAARDRLWQIDLGRKRGLGLLAASFGPGYFAQDRAARLFLYRGDMAAEWAAYGAPDTREIVEAFVAGINAWVALARREPARLPPEFAATGTTPDFWDASDVVRIRSHALVHNLQTEVTRALVLARADRTTDLARRSIDPPHDVTVPDGLDLAEIPLDVLDVFALATAPVTFSRERLAATSDQTERWSKTTESGEIRFAASDEGSNNWAIAPQRSATGRAILASDPHRAFQLPSLRYVAHLTSPGLDVIGAGEPGLPGISIGHNGHVAFGLTIFRADQEDLHVYETHPDDPGLYRYGERWERMRTIRETIAVKGAPEREIALKFTRHGPVLCERAAQHRAFGLRTVWMEPGAAAYFGSIAYQTARTVDDFEAALAHWSTPSVNQVCADVSGRILWTPAAKAPRRPNWDGMLPVPGDGRYEWDGFHGRDVFPREVDPARGYVASANEMNLPEGPARLLGFGHEWAEPFRAQRLREALDAEAPHGLDFSARLQGDVLSIPARRICALLAGLTANDAATSAALALLRPWDRRLEIDSAAALLFEIWWMKHLKPALLDRATADPQVRRLLAPGDQVTLIDWLERAAVLFGATPEQTRAACLRETLAAAWRDCIESFGDPAGWRWSLFHHGYFEHPLTPLGAHGVRDVGPLPKGGSNFTVMNTGYRLSDGRAITGASFRMVVDVGAWDNSQFVNAPGQSGDPASPHFDDHAAVWSQSGYFPLLYSPAAVDAAARVRLRLQPAPPRDAGTPEKA
jgi:penicillin amidase